MLEVSDVHAYYGDSHVLQGVSLALGPGEIVCLLGRNGAGKTTTMRSIVGYVPPAAGRVVFDGEVVSGRPVYENVRRGIGFVPEDRRIFPALTVEENLEVARLPPRPGLEPWTLDRVFHEFPLLQPLRRQKGGALSGGEQQMLAIARGLMADPLLLMLDEPSLGLAPVLVISLFEIIRKLKEEGLTMLLVEQNVHLALAVSDYAYVLSQGRVEIEGEAGVVREMNEVRHAYLGL